MLLAGGFFIGDILFQLIAFLLVIIVPFVIVLLIRKRSNRLRRMEEKLDMLLEKEDKH